MNKLIFSKAGTDKLFAFKYIDEKIDSIEYCDSESIIGNIYVGIVADIVKNINAAFINFADNKKGYYLIDSKSITFLNTKNTDKVCQGDRVLVQVTSDKIKTKEYTLSTSISFSGRYVVFVSGRSELNISKKIADLKYREYLKDNLTEMITDDYGFILRTNCAQASIEDVKNEMLAFTKQWEYIKNKAMHLTAGSKVYSNDSDALCIAREFTKQKDEQTKIITDVDDIFNQLKDEIDLKNTVIELYQDSFPLHKIYSLENLMKTSVSKKVWMDSGAYLIIEHTETLNVIDVNSGKISKSGKRDEMLLKINLEAAKCAALEIRKRNLSGIIIIDFINMKKKEYNDILVHEMKKLTSNDSITTVVAGLSNLGLMEITRKRTKKPLYEILNKI